MDPGRNKSAYFLTKIKHGANASQNKGTVNAGMIIFLLHSPETWPCLPPHWTLLLSERLAPFTNQQAGLWEPALVQLQCTLPKGCVWTITGYSSAALRAHSRQISLFSTSYITSRWYGVIATYLHWIHSTCMQKQYTIAWAGCRTMATPLHPNIDNTPMGRKPETEHSNPWTRAGMGALTAAERWQLFHWTCWAVVWGSGNKIPQWQPHLPAGCADITSLNGKYLLVPFYHGQQGDALGQCIAYSWPKMGDLPVSYCQLQCKIIDHIADTAWKLQLSSAFGSMMLSTARTSSTS